MHGALLIQSGERINLIIIWMCSSVVRKKLCPMCNRVPRLMPSFWGSGDGFTVNPVSVCAALYRHQVPFSLREGPYDSLRRCKNCSKYCNFYRGPERVYS